MSVTVNLNAVFISIETATGVVAPGWSESDLSRVITQTNRVWQQAGVRFTVNNTSSECVQLPGTGSAGQVDDTGFFILQAEIAPRDRITVGLVNQVASRISAGRATVGGRFTLQPHRGVSASYKPLALAHELGHILGLEHVTSDSLSVQERLAATGNLMTPGIIQANPVLTETQISTVTSNAARRRPAAR